MSDVPRDPATSLNSEQLDVVGLPATSRTLVLAAAGTGKTLTLSARIATLLEQAQLQPEEVLVLSFSRAAVNALRNRTFSMQALIAVTPMTFDSFATRLLDDIDPAGAWQTKGYDGRIVDAVTRLGSEGREIPLIASAKHILIDEAQDLLGPRRSLVQGLLEATTGGFSLFADPAQTIYDFEHPSRRPHEADLLEWVRSRFSESLLERRLTTNYRALSPVTQRVLPFGNRLESPSHTVGVRGDLDNFLLDLQHISSLHNALPLLKRRDGLTTAVLARTNAQALLISRGLFKLQIPHNLRRSLSERLAPAWVASAVRGFQSVRVAKTRMLATLQGIAFEKGLAAEGLWRQLKVMDARRSDDLDLRRIASKIQNRQLPEGFDNLEPSHLVVSTIHRAKGLEFDRVILVDPGFGDGQHELEEARVIYVALTRARQDLFVLSAPDTRSMKSLPWAESRWIQFEGYGGSAKSIGIEVRGSDIDVTSPASALSNSADVLATQDYISRSISVGDPVQLVLGANEGRSWPVYRLEHNGRHIGVTSDAFADVVNRLHPSQSPPRRIHGINVESIDTVVGEARVGEGHGLGVSGMWCRVRPIGLGVLEY